MITLEALTLCDSTTVLGVVYRIKQNDPHSLGTWGWLNNLTGEGGSYANSAMAKDALAYSVVGMVWEFPE